MSSENISDEAARRYPEDYKTIGGHAMERRAFIDGAQWAREARIRSEQSRQMMNEQDAYTPTTFEIREWWSMDRDNREAANAEFDRWLAGFKRDFALRGPVPVNLWVTH